LDKVGYPGWGNQHTEWHNLARPAADTDARELRVVSIEYLC
jgi:hypothetical protein